MRKMQQWMVAVGCAVAGSVWAQPVTPVCDGEVQMIRVSTLKGGATVADFEKVVAEHMA